MIEEFRDIEGYEELYQVSNYGKVKSLERTRKGGYNSNVKVKEKILNFLINKNGYLYVNLYKNAKSKHKFVHRLVAEAFIPNPNNLPQINHKDENKENNCVDNLEWCTNQYNMNYGTLRKRVIKTQTIKFGKKINQYDLQGNFIKQWNSGREIERNIGIFHQNILACCQGKTKTCGGYIWKYVNI